MVLFGPPAMSDLSQQCGLKLTSADHSEFLGSRRRFVDFTMRLQSAPNWAPLEVSFVQPPTIPSLRCRGHPAAMALCPISDFPKFRLTAGANQHYSDSIPSH